MVHRVFGRWARSVAELAVDGAVGNNWGRTGAAEWDGGANWAGQVDVDWMAALVDEWVEHGRRRQRETDD